MLNRLSLVNYRGFPVTPDTQDALVRLGKRADEAGKWALTLLGPSPGAGKGNMLSLASAGREVHFRLSRSDRDEQTALNAAWACAIPLGFTPHDRWPRVSPTSHIYYYLGPWQTLNDRLLAEGRGHLAWPSVCAAAQADVGVWSGDKTLERFVQAQLHRVGKNIGPVDGVIGPRTTTGVESLGLKRPTLPQVAEHLRVASLTPPKSQAQKPLRGHLSVPGYNVRVQAFGGVQAQQHGDSGAFLTATGPGRLVVEVQK